MQIHELWDEPWEGMPEDEEAWTWDLVDEEESADRDPASGKWFNPHRSSGAD
jgi:hypothetical protein